MLYQNDFLRDEIYPGIYSGYNDLLNRIYSANGLSTKIEQQSYLQYLQVPAKELHQSYYNTQQKPQEKQFVEVDYTNSQFQEVYLLRYFFPHSLIVPSIYHRHLKNFHHIENELLTTSFFGSGPGPELYGLMCYLSNCKSPTVMISSAMLDSVSTSWKYGKNIVRESLINCAWDPGLYEIAEFELNLAGESNHFLSGDSETWVRESSLIVLQFCLNEVPDSSYEQLLMNMTHIVDIMKPGALMLVIDRYGYVKKLYENIHSSLAIEFNNIQIHHEPFEKIDIKYLNYDEHVPIELIDHLFLRIFDNWLWLTNQISYQWIVISKY